MVSGVLHRLYVSAGPVSDPLPSYSLPLPPHPTICGRSKILKKKQTHQGCLSGCRVSTSWSQFRSQYQGLEFKPCTRPRAYFKINSHGYLWTMCCLSCRLVIFKMLLGFSYNVWNEHLIYTTVVLVEFLGLSCFLIYVNLYEWVMGHLTTFCVLVSTKWKTAANVIT